jgi:hypothetical protein
MLDVPVTHLVQLVLHNAKPRASPTCPASHPLPSHEEIHHVNICVSHVYTYQMRYPLSTPTIVGLSHCRYLSRDYRHLSLSPPRYSSPFNHITFSLSSVYQVSFPTSLVQVTSLSYSIHSPHPCPIFQHPASHVSSPIFDISSSGLSLSRQLALPSAGSRRSSSLPV